MSGIDFLVRGSTETGIRHIIAELRQLSMAQ